jgi:hypothetical protein
LGGGLQNFTYLGGLADLLHPLYGVLYLASCDPKESAHVQKNVTDTLSMIVQAFGEENLKYKVTENKTSETKSRA